MVEQGPEGGEDPISPSPGESQGSQNPDLKPEKNSRWKKRILTARNDRQLVRRWHFTARFNQRVFRHCIASYPEPLTRQKFEDIWAQYRSQFPKAQLDLAEYLDILIQPKVDREYYDIKLRDIYANIRNVLLEYMPERSF